METLNIKFISKKRFFDVLVSSVKILTATMAAILIAKGLNLEFYITAGVAALLSVQSSKKETIYTAISRLFGFLVAMFLSYFLYDLLGFTLSAYFIILGLTILICYFFKWQNSLSLNTVLISHFVHFEEITFHALKNEFLLFVIGVTCGIIVNLHLRKRSNEFEKKKFHIDDLLASLVARISQRLLDSEEEDISEDVFDEINEALIDAKHLALHNYNNQLKEDNKDILLIDIREKQVFILFEIYDRVKKLNPKLITATLISDFLNKLSYEFQSHNVNPVFGHHFNDEFSIIWEKLKDKPLPTTRKEFENRAELYILLESISELLTI